MNRLIRAAALPAAALITWVVLLTSIVSAAHRPAPPAHRPGPPAPAPTVAIGQAAPRVAAAPAHPRASRSAARREVLDWAALAACESGGDPRALSPTGAFRGLYQFRLATWRWVGGGGDPVDATRQEQSYRARLLFERAGAAPWPVCGRQLRARP